MLAFFAIVAAACAPRAPLVRGSDGDPSSFCSAAWYESIDGRVPTTDAQGHGPDVGTDEWKSVIELRLGIRHDPNVPSRDGDAWCRYVDAIVRGRTASPIRAGAATAGGTPLACAKAKAGNVDEAVCKDPELAALDRTLSDALAAASESGTIDQLQQLETEQRGWTTERDRCWRGADRRGCVRDAYRRRIAELQARYRLISGIGPFAFACDGAEIAVTFFETDPPTLIAERGDGVALMYRQASAGGAKYQGGNGSFWERGGEATVTWGDGAAAMRCTKTQPPS